MFQDNSMFMLDSRDFTNNDNILKPRKSSRQTYKHNIPRVKNDLYLPPQQLTNSRRSQYEPPIEHNPVFDEIIGNTNSYRKKLNNAEIQMNEKSFMDLDSKVVIPRMNSKKNSNENKYSNVPFMNGQLRDVDIENCMRTGSTRSKAKTNGYRNPFEHYFQYVDGEMQKPEHTIFERGIPTRLLNKEFANKTKKREIY
jgi:hypothetical protein